MFVNDRDEMSNLYRGHSIDASYQLSVHLAKRFQRRRFLKIGQSETRIAFLIFFLANLAKGNMSFRHHLMSVVCHPFTFHILIFSSENPQPNEKQELPVATMFVNGSGQNEHIYRGPSIDASYKVSVHLAKRFQGRRF
jgi:hypothetical protein